MKDPELQSEATRLNSACDQYLRPITPEVEPLSRRLAEAALSTIWVTGIALIPALLCYALIDKAWAIHVFCSFVIYLGLYELGDILTTSLWANSTNVSNRVAAVTYCLTNIGSQVESLRSGGAKR